MGLTALTMRSLGAALGVEAMSLYHHVRSREILLDAMAEQLMDDVDQARGNEPAGLAWPELMTSMATEMRRTALAHPRAFPLLAVRRPPHLWLRPPLRRLSWTEQLLDRLTSGGMRDVDAVASYHHYTSFLLGYLLLDVQNPTLSPLTAGLAPPLSTATPRGEMDFSESLDDLINWLSRGRSAA